MLGKEVVILRKWRQYIQSILQKRFALPSDVIHELTRITIIGELHAYIENHQGLQHYSDKELLLRGNQGNVQIRGEGFVLKMMLPEEILLEGKIAEVRFLPYKETH